MINDEEIIPKISKDVEFIALEDGWTLCFQKKYGYRLKIDESTAKFLLTIDGKTSIKELANNFNKITNEKIPIEEYVHLLKGTLRKSGTILLGDAYQVSTASPSYLRLRINLISSNQSAYITRFLKSLFRESLFWPSFIILNIGVYGAFLFYVKEMYYNLDALTLLDIIPVLCMMGVALFGHELGHASACDCYGASHGNIGFGFYLFTPVMFADVSDIWRLPKRKRIIVNLGGIYIGNIFASVYLLLYLITKNIIFLYAFSLQSLESLYNLNPLIKYDGYWVLSDLLNFSNMSQQAYTQLKEFSLFSIKKYHFREWYLVVYGLISPIFILCFILSVLILNPESVLYFPRDIVFFIYQAICDTSAFNFRTLTNFAPAILFYILLFRTIKKIVKKKLIS